MKGKVYYAYCPSCPDYHEDADSLQQAREKLEQHESQKHKGKQVGTFGVQFKQEKENE